MRRSIWLLAAGLGALALLVPLGAVGAAKKPSVQFKSGSYSVNENTSPAAITVTLSAKSQNLLTVWFRTAGGSATGGASCAPGVDFINTDTQMVFNPGQTQLTASVPICNDTLDETNETVTLQLYNPSNNLSLGSKSQTTLTITDDDPSVAISVGDANADEGDPVVFNVTLSAPSAQTVAVSWTTAANGSASATFNGSADNHCGAPLNPDYVSAAGALAFAAGETSKQVSITTCDDLVAESDETFTLNLSAPANATIADGTGVGTIKNDDAPCSPGSEDWSSYNEGDMPTTFGGGAGTIDPNRIGTVVVSSDPTYPAGTKVYTGDFINTLTFTTISVGSFSIDTGPGLIDGGFGLTAYDANDVVVDSDAATSTAHEHVSLSVSSATNNIKYVQVTHDQPFGFNFTNLAWTCNT